MTEKELIEDVKDELTFSRGLPYTLPDKEIIRQIKIAEKFFIDNWRHAVESKYILLPKAIFKTKQFKEHRQIKLPDCIQFCYGLKEIKGGSIFATIDKDFSEQKFIGSEIFLTPFMGESIMYRTIVFSFLDLTKNLIIDTIAYGYNKNTKILTVIGRTPITDVVAQVYRIIERESLFEDELFQRYIRAKAKVRLGDLVKTFDFKLPGGITINYDIVVTKAEKELEDVVSMMKTENVPDFMILDRT